MPDPDLINGRGSKRVAETFRVSFDFAKGLDADETVTGVVVTAVDDLGASCTSDLIDQPVASGTKALWWWKPAGVNGRNYFARIEATTSQAAKRVAVVKLEVRGA